MGLADRAAQTIKRDPLRKYKENLDAPDWMGGAGVWFGAAAISIALIVALIIGFATEGNEPQAQEEEEAPEPVDVGPGGGDDELPETNQQDVPMNGNGEEETSEPTETAEDTPSQDEDDTAGDFSEFDFQEQGTTNIPVDGSSLPTNVDRGAINLADAAAQAYTDGNIESLPTTSDIIPWEEMEGASVNLESRMLDEPARGVDEDTIFTFIYSVEGADTNYMRVRIGFADGGESFVVHPHEF